MAPVKTDFSNTFLKKENWGVNENICDRATNKFEEIKSLQIMKNSLPRYIGC